MDLIDLASAPQLNLQRCRALRFDAWKGRYAVQLSGGREVSVRAVNLRPVAAEGAHHACPICLDVYMYDPLRSSGDDMNSAILVCCGKFVCSPCHQGMLESAVRRDNTFGTCPFCLAPVHEDDGPATLALTNAQELARAAAGDPVVQCMVSCMLDRGAHGYPLDPRAAVRCAILAGRQVSSNRRLYGFGVICAPSMSYKHPHYARAYARI